MSSVMAEEMDESNGLNDKEMCDDCDDLKVSDDHKKEIPETNHGERRTAEKPFVLKKWNCCAMWRWDCEMRHLCHMSGPSDGRMSALVSRRTGRMTVWSYGESATTPSTTAACLCGSSRTTDVLYANTNGSFNASANKRQHKLNI